MGKYSHEMNITHYQKQMKFLFSTDPGRTRRPLIVVKDGESTLKDEHIEALESGEMSWDDI